MIFLKDGTHYNMTIGPVWAFNASNGERLWKWKSIPDPSDTLAYRTWLNGTYGAGGGNVWHVMSSDTETNLIFLTVGSASPDYFGGRRPGDNLYTGSIVALDAYSGKIRWFFQTVRHDIWDLDGGNQPSVTYVNGKKVVVFRHQISDDLDIGH